VFQPLADVEKRVAVEGICPDEGHCQTAITTGILARVFCPIFTVTLAR
jgi:hypothetical protein